MKHRCLGFLAASLALVFTGTARADFNWTSLWRTPDQQGEALLDQGKADEAAGTYSDPRRKAFAELRAGHYTEAANDLSPFDDAEALYNRGNALAFAGQLPQALAAYDAALKQHPGDHDAQHNRELVAKAMEHQKQNQKDSDQNSGGQKDSKPPQADQGQQGQGGHSSQNQSGQASDNQGAQASQNSQPQQGQAADAGKSDGQPSSSGADAKSPSPSSGNGAGQDAPKDAADDREKGSEGESAPSPAQPKDSGPGSQNQTTADTAAPASGSRDQTLPGRENTAKTDSEDQARQDVQAGLTQAAQAGSDQKRGRTGVEVPNPPTEQQMAQEQWLRQIPDDPGGLLRRKFMIEHLMRQQQPQAQRQAAP